MDADMTFSRGIDEIVLGLQRVILGLNMLKGGPPAAAVETEESFDPRDAANKYEIGGLEKLTARGVEICYRLFDSGKSRYAVANLMDISFGAANHRYHAWLKAGGRDRKRNMLGDL